MFVYPSSTPIEAGEPITIDSFMKIIRITIHIVQKYENERQKTKQVLIPIPNAKTRNKDVEVWYF